MQSNVISKIWGPRRRVILISGYFGFPMWKFMWKLLIEVIENREESMEEYGNIMKLFLGHMQVINKCLEALNLSK